MSTMSAFHNMNLKCSVVLIWFRSHACSFYNLRRLTMVFTQEFPCLEAEIRPELKVFLQLLSAQVEVSVL